MTGPGGLGSAGDGGSAGPTSLRVRAEHEGQDLMVEHKSGQAKPVRKTKGRRFFEIDADYNRGGKAGFELESGSAALAQNPCSCIRRRRTWW